MPRDINERLDNLHKRRRGTDQRSYSRLNDEARLDVIAKSAATESWQRRAATKPYTRYALGAMQSVGEQYTRICIETAERVGNQLISKVPISLEFRLQGSVPLDVHIRGVSDVDLLTLDTSFCTYATNGARSLGGYYTPTTSRTSLGVLLNLRAEEDVRLWEYCSTFELKRKRRCGQHTQQRRSTVLAGNVLPFRGDRLLVQWT
jgi:hypothetical protein